MFKLLHNIHYRSFYTKLCITEIKCNLVFNLILSHMMMHDGEAAKKFGPSHGRWMYFFERYNSVLTRRNLSMVHPEACIMQTMQIHDWVHDVIISKRLCGTSPTNLTNVTESLNEVGENPFKNSRKRKRRMELNPFQIATIKHLLNVPALLSTEENVVKWYRSKRLDSVGNLLYQSGVKDREDYRKS